MQQSEDQFGYTVIALAFDRSADLNRFLDTLFFGLMAVQAAIYAIILDKIGEYPAVDWGLLLAGFLIAILGTGLSLFVCDGPNPKRFADSFPNEPKRTRSEYIDEYIKNAVRNERLRLMKTTALWLALVLTVAPVMIATAGRAWRV